ncbi:MAG: toll/interleukin-1 receptor domain-containing protein [Bacteroidaceae bacterium]|nr:toll/interleukin-1 receptor domain-containing protein [Bacteroidaceae bacterium]
MGNSRQKLHQLKCLYSKQLKRPVNDVVKLMPLGFTDDMFILKFIHCYEYLWLDLQKEWKFYRHKNKVFKGKKHLLFPSPYRMVLSAAYHLLNKAKRGHLTQMSGKWKKEQENRLVDACQKKLSERKEKQRLNTELLQNAVPNYAHNMIESYYFLRHFHREDVNGRFYVLNEIAKFNHSRFVGFFINVMKSERNDFCREFAFRTLQKWGKTVHLPKKPKGKKHPSDKIVPTIPTNPEEQIALIEKLQMEHDKSYNVFISHRSLDRVLIIKIKDMLNGENLSVYVDWMIDKDGLPREKLSDKTLATLEVRMKHCDRLLYVHTKNCKDSEYIKWELNLAQQYNIPVTILNAEDVFESDEMRHIPHVHIKKNKLFVMIQDKEILYKSLFSQVKSQRNM